MNQTTKIRLWIAAVVLGLIINFEPAIRSVIGQ